MKIEDINSSSVRTIPNKELLNLHFRIHQLASAFKDKDDKRSNLTWEDLVNAHIFIVKEMERRNLKHNVISEIDEDTNRVLQSGINILDVLQNAKEEVVLVPNFICVVGSAVHSNEPEDIDILIRADKKDNNYLIRFDNVFLPVRNVFRDLDKKIHIVENPQGSHGDFIPMYDLVLRRRKTFEVEVVKNNVVKVDLGCGPNKPEGYIGIDKEQYNGVDIIADLEYGIPLPDDYADEIRAFHILEHISDRDFIMSEIYRVLKPGGRLVFEVPSTNSEGAFVPGHKSFWNKTVFYFYSDPKLVENRPKFEIEELEEIERNGYKYVVGVLVKPIYIDGLETLKRNEVAPFDRIVPQKPAMKMFSAQTEAFSVDEIYDWFESHKENGIVAEEKLNGFRCLIHKKDNKVMIYFEDAQKERDIKEVVSFLKSIEDDFILDCDIGIVKNGKRQPRLYLMRLTSKHLEFEEDEYPIITVFDILYLNEDLTQKSFKERRKILEEFYKKYLSNSKFFDITEQFVVKTKEDLEKAWKTLGARYMSEGIVLKDLSAKYEFGPTNSLAKIKHICEIKAIVTDIKENKNGTYSLRCGILKGKSDFVADENGIIDLGYTFNTPLKPEIGDIVTVQVEEIIIRQDNKGNKHLDWLGPIVVDVDKTRKEPYFANQVIDMAKRNNILYIVEKIKIEDEEKETRAQKAIKFWAENWYKIYPKSGKGRFVYQLHIRGLEKDEIDLGLKELLERGHSVHGDLRFETDNGLWGFTIFEGSAEDVLKTEHLSRLIDLQNDDSLQATPKLLQPKEWLKVGIKPFISPPGGVGSTSKKYSKIFAIDSGQYHMGVWKEHLLEVFLDGKHLNGRLLFLNIPIDGERIWIVNRPKDQSPLADRISIEKELKELKAKKQKYLIVSKPKMRPKLYKVEANDNELDVKNYYFEVAKIIEEERFVLAPFAVPYSVDLKNHKIVNIESLEKALHDFVAFNGSIMYMHSKPAPNVRIAEAYILRDDMEINGKVFPKGTAMIGLKILDDKLWEMIKSGKIKGVSYRAIVRKN